MNTIRLPGSHGALEAYRLTGPRAFPRHPANHPLPRIAYAAAHVVIDPLLSGDPWSDPRIDWDATLAYRHSLWSHGLGVAEAMDTAQRGAGLHWPLALELIQRSAAEAKAAGGLLACGAGTDQLEPVPGVTLGEVISAYEQQCQAVEAAGGRIILMASRALAACARSTGRALPPPISRSPC